MSLYVKKALPVNAVQWRGGDQKHPAVFCEWIGNVYTDGSEYVKEVWYCKTLENQRLYFQVGDYVVGPGAGGEYWPVKREIFEATYEPYYGEA